MIEIDHLTKRYGNKVAVDDLTCTIKPGIVTGFLGPNGSGKSTTMRSIVGLDTPTSGHALVNGKKYSEFKAPLSELGALLEAKSVHPGRSAYKHLLALAHTHGIGARRVNEVIDLVGLHDVAKKPAGKFSLGMGQRLGIAVALLGDPKTIILDEPVNGLDPEGVKWIRELLRKLAAEGRTVFLSSHLMSELSQTADHIIVIGQGKLLADMSIDELLLQAGGGIVTVKSPDAGLLARAVAGAGVSVTSIKSNELTIHGISAENIGTIAHKNGVILYELSTATASLEQVFMDMTSDSVEYRQSAADNNAIAQGAK